MQVENVLSGIKTISNKILSKIIVLANTLAVPIFLLLIWQFLSSQGFLLEVILPSPVKVMRALWEMIADGTLKIDLWVSLQRVLWGYFYGSLTGIILGIGSGLNKYIYRLVSPVINVIRQIPLYAWMPLIILWFGIGEVSKIVIIARGVMIPIYLNTVQGIREVNIQYYELAQVLELRHSIFLKKIVWPSALSSVFTGLRLAAGNAWMAVVAAEMLGGLTGLGYALLQAKEFLWSDKLIALMVVIAVVGIMFDSLIKGIENHSLSWRKTIGK